MDKAEVGFQYSTSIDISALADSGCLTSLRVRRSIRQYEDIAIKATQENLKHITQELRDASVDGYSFAPIGHVTAFAVPEALPERIAAITGFIDLALLHDDIIDSMDVSESRKWNKGWADDYGILGPSNNEVDRRFNKKQAEAKMLWEVIAIDRKHGMRFLTGVTKLLSTWSCSTPTDFLTFADWLQFRYDDVFAEASFEISLFGVGLNAPDTVRNATAEVIRPILLFYGPLNDFYSFDKEYDAHISQPGSAPPLNTVFWLMSHYNIGIREAKSLLQHMIYDSEQEYCSRRRQYEKQNDSIPLEVTKYLDTAEFMFSGTSYWSSFAPRYPQKPEYSIDTASNRRDRLVPIYCPKDLNVASVLRIVAPAVPNSNEHTILQGGTSTVPPLIEEKFSGSTYGTISEEVVLSPYTYLKCLPSKNMRSIAIDALNIWFQLPSHALSAIKNITDLLHNSSLMLDDIEDKSTLHRGKPAVRTIFGVSQTINSANYLFVIALDELRKWSSDKALSIFVKELRQLHLGQSKDLSWTFQVCCPSVSDYIAMVDHKTGGLFRLLGCLMHVESSARPDADIEGFTTIVGRYFQVRDDYQNIVSHDYKRQKGFCDDLDEGKFSLPLIHTLSQENQDSDVVWSILHERRRHGRMTDEAKRLILEVMVRCGSLHYTKTVLRILEQSIEAEIARLEDVLGARNYVLRLFVERLKI